MLIFPSRFAVLRGVPAVALLVFWLAPLAAPAQTFSPQVEEIIRHHVEPNEENPEYKRRRDAWLESLHRTEPGLNWRAIDRENRQAIRALRSQPSGRGTGRAMQGAADTIPGVISGTWMERGSQNLSGRMVHADVDLERGLIYAASGGGNIWRGGLDATGWRSLNDTLRMPGASMLRVVPRPGGPRILVAAGGPTGVYLSDDDGLSWHRSTGLQDIEAWGSWKEGAMLDDPGHTIYMLGNEWDWNQSRQVTVLYRSTDAGDSFSKVYTTQTDISMVDIWAPRYDGSDLMMLNNDTLSRVEPNGTVRKVGMLKGQSTFSRYMSLYLTGTLAGGRMHLYALLWQGGDNTEWYTSSDTGRTWRYVNSSVNPFSSNSIAVSSVDSDATYIGGVNCFRGKGGTFAEVSNWSEYYDNPTERLHADIFGIHPIRDASGSEFVLVCTDGGIYVSFDGINTVSNLSLDGLNVSQYYSTLTSWKNPSICHAGSQDQGYQRTDLDGGGVLHFRQEISGDYGHLTSSDSGRTVWSNYPGFTLLARENEEGNGVNLLMLNFKRNAALWLPPIVANPADPNSAILVGGAEDGQGSHLWRMTALEDRITSEQMPFDFSLNSSGRSITAAAISSLDPSRWFVATNDGRFFRSSDAGAAWQVSTDSSAPGNHYFYGSVVLPSPVDANRVYVAGSGYSTPAVKVSVDGGRTFRPIIEGLPQTLVYDMAVDPEERFLYAATELGPYLYSVQHERWYYLGAESAPDQTYWSVEYIPTNGVARFGTYGRGIWDFVAERPSSVRPESPAPAVPAIALTAVPNPARAESALSFTVPSAGHVRLRVYDLTGREVASLVDRHLEAGTHQVVWDLRSPAGKPLPSGSYTCVVSAGRSIGFVRVEVVR